MVFEGAAGAVASAFTTLSLSEAWSVLGPLIIFVIGMVIYSLFVFHFYRFIAKRDIFSFEQASSAHGRVLYALKYVFLFPIIAFAWFFVVAVLLSLLSSVIEIGNIFMISMATLATIRVAAYYNEKLSEDIAKLVPFALLAVFLLDISTISAAKPLLVLSQISLVADALVYYFIFIVVLELVFRAATFRR